MVGEVQGRGGGAHRVIVRWSTQQSPHPKTMCWVHQGALSGCPEHRGRQPFSPEPNSKPNQRKLPFLAAHSCWYFSASLGFCRHPCLSCFLALSGTDHGAAAAADRHDTGGLFELELSARHDAGALVRVELSAGTYDEGRGFDDFPFPETLEVAGGAGGVVFVHLSGPFRAPRETCYWCLTTGTENPAPVVHGRLRLVSTHIILRLTTGSRSFLTRLLFAQLVQYILRQPSFFQQLRERFVLLL